MDKEKTAMLIGMITSMIVTTLCMMLQSIFLTEIGIENSVISIIIGIIIGLCAEVLWRKK